MKQNLNSCTFIFGIYLIWVNQKTLVWITLISKLTKIGNTSLINFSHSRHTQKCANVRWSTLILKISEKKSSQRLVRAFHGVFHNMFGFVLLIAHTRGPPHRSANSHFSYLSFRLTNNALPAAPGGQRAGDFGPSAAAAHSP
jgi:hypothetical protein